MTGPVKERHDEVVRTLAERYRRDGYLVEVEPRLSTLTGESVTADLLAKRGSQTVLVEVRIVTSSRSEPILKELSEIAHQNGWKFVIVIADGTTIEEVDVPSPADIRAKLHEANAVARDSSTSASLLAWSAFEAAARLFLTRSARRLTRPTPPRTLIQQLAALGALDVEEEQALNKFADQRNRFAHGLWSSVDSPVDIRLVVQIAERLVASDPLRAPA